MVIAKILEEGLADETVDTANENPLSFTIFWFARGQAFGWSHGLTFQSGCHVICVRHFGSVGLPASHSTRTVVIFV